MTLSSEGVLLFATVFTRLTAMLLSAPYLGSVVPVNVRVLFGVVLSAALTPILPLSVAPPTSVFSLALHLASEALFGIVVGSTLQLIVSVFQSAGSVLDIQIGTSASQVLNPLAATPMTPVSQFKVTLCVVLLFLSDAHHLMLQCIVASYSTPLPPPQSVLERFLVFLSGTSAFAIQVAAPVAVATVAIDLAAGLVNKAVPQTQPFLLALPVKISVGMLLLALGLPIMVVSVQSALQMAGHTLYKLNP